MTPLEVKVHDVPGGTIVVAIGGEAVVDLEPLVATLQTVSARRPNSVVLDLKDLSFISSLAMGVMLAFRRGVLANNGKLKVAGMQKLVLDAFKRARLDRVFDITETLDAALAK